MVVGILGALGGVVVFLGAVFALMRGLFGIIHATEDNTSEVKGANNRLDEMNSKLDGAINRIARLEGRAGYESNGSNSR